MKLGICDYGIGGMGVYKTIRFNSQVEILYFSDSGYIPYGKLSATELKERLEFVFSFLKSKGVTHIAVACNAASSVLLDHKYTKLTHIIDHAVEMIQCYRLKEIGIVGGIQTIKSNCYGNKLLNIKTHQRIAQQLSIRIEKGDLHSKEMIRDIETIFEPLQDQEYILLACTHYPVISKLINNFCPTSTLLYPSHKMAEWMLQNWNIKKGNSVTQWYTTGEIEQMKMASKKAFGIEITDVKKVIIS